MKTTGRHSDIERVGRKIRRGLSLAVLVALLSHAAEQPARSAGPAQPPVIGAWFWTQRELEPEGYKDFLDAAAAQSPYTLLSTACRRIEVTEPAMREQADKAVRYANAKGLRVALEVDVRLARQAFRARYPDELQEELVLKFVDFTNAAPAEVVFQGVDTGDHMNGSLPKYECLATRLVRAYAFTRGAEGLDPASVRDVTADAVSTADGPRKLTVRLSVPRGACACVISAHTVLTPDVFAPHLLSFQREIIKRYADVPLAGIMKDEWGFPPDHTGNPRHDRFWFSAALARAYGERAGGADLVRDALLMCAGEKGRERERLAAINRFGALCRARNAEVETDFYRAGKEVFGPDALIVTHATWTPYPGPQEFRKNGLSWWDATRDIGQSDESTPYPCRTSLAKRWGYPLWYNQYYAKEVDPYVRELWQGALSGGRLNVHPLYPRQDLKGGERENLLLRSGLMAGMARLRVLDAIARAPLACPAAVIFGHACAMNWAGPSYNRVGLEVASSLCAAGYPADVFPTSVVGAKALRLDAEGYVCLGPQRYRTVILYRPEFCGEAELEFFSRAAAGKSALFLVGEWTRDAEARPLATDGRLGASVRRCASDEACAAAALRALDASGVERITAWDRKNVTHPLPPTDGFAVLTDGTYVRAAGAKSAAGDAIRETLLCQGRAVEVDAVGVVAIRFAADGRVDAFAAGGLKRVKAGGLLLELREPVDLAFERQPDGAYAGFVQGLAGEVPAPLLSLTTNWRRLGLPLP